MTNEKIVDRIKKLLALAADGSGATEAEAQSAAAKAAEIMEDHGLTQMTVEMAGGQGETRDKINTKTVNWPWYMVLMEALAESCFCSVDQVPKGGRKFEFRLIGRVSAVMTANMTFEYLGQTIRRLSRETNVESPHYFCCGAAERIAERIRQRHEEKLAEQKAAAEAAERARATASPSSGTAIVVTLVDHAKREADLNEDFRQGLRPGMTAEKRAVAEAREAAKRAVYDRLLAEGVANGVAWNMAYLGQSRAEAEEYEAEFQASNAKRSARTFKASWTKADEARWQSQQRREARKDSSSWQEGRRRGDDVGLDQQVTKHDNRRIT